MRDDNVFKYIDQLVYEWIIGHCKNIQNLSPNIEKFSHLRLIINDIPKP